jgi:hypothetical protein
LCVATFAYHQGGGGFNRKGGPRVRCGFIRVGLECQQLTLVTGSFASRHAGWKRLAGNDGFIRHDVACRVCREVRLISPDCGSVPFERCNPSKGR